MIHLLFTGGTISMQRDPAAGGNVPTHGGEALVEFAGGLDRISTYQVENWAKLPACHLGPSQLWALRERVREIAQAEQVAGIVITHGTDTIEETAYLLDRTLDPTLPIVLTGAMRTSSDHGWDGPRNLLDAAAVAADAASRGRGTLVVFHGQIFQGRSAVKVHATALDAFGAPHGGVIGTVTAGEVSFGAPPDPRGPPLRAGDLGRRVALIPVIVGDDGRLLDLARPHYDGVVLEAFGSGNAPPGVVSAMTRWIDEGKPVVLASRCPLGEVTPIYAFEGGGARLVARGAIPAGPRTPSQARIELALSLSAGVPYGAR